MTCARAPPTRTACGADRQAMERALVCRRERTAGEVMKEPGRARAPVAVLDRAGHAIRVCTRADLARARTRPIALLMTPGW